MDSKVIGRKIRALRSKQGLTGVALAKLVKLTPAHVHNLEAGVCGFRNSTLTRLARALGVKPAYFLVDGEDGGQADVAAALEEHGLTPSRTLTEALKDQEFLRFIEKCARFTKLYKKNLGKLEKALGGVVN